MKKEMYILGQLEMLVRNLHKYGGASAELSEGLSEELSELMLELEEENFALHQNLLPFVLVWNEFEDVSALESIDDIVFHYVNDEM